MSPPVSTAADPFHRALYLTGPTASGKTAVGVALAARLDAEVVALDAMTLYRGMDIGTAKPDAAERAGVPHHLIDVLDPWDAASVADYRRLALEAVLAIEARGRRPLFVGGTPMYLKALLRGLFDGPGADPGLRAALEAEADREGDAALHRRLAGLDPAAAARIHPNDRRRVVRALEVAALTGRPISDHQNEHGRPAEGVVVLALERPREELHRRIDRRVVAMFEAGLVDEVRRLLDGPRPPHPVPMQGVGYREAQDLLEGRLARDAAIERTQARTRQFAKRQGTWFRGLAEVEMAAVGDDEPADAVAERLAARVASLGSTNDRPRIRVDGDRPGG